LFCPKVFKNNNLGLDYSGKVLILRVVWLQSIHYKGDGLVIGAGRNE
jgi:hypothetical protein